MKPLLDKLDEIEAEMKAIGFWSPDDLPPEAPPDGSWKTFEHWLQYGFLPSARYRIFAKDMPKTSQVAVMAMREYDYHSYVPEAQRLLSLLSEFDALAEGRQQ